jgi:hypothetical protein
LQSLYALPMQFLPAHVMPRFHSLSTSVMQVDHLLPENRTYARLLSALNARKSKAKYQIQ